MLEYFGVCGSYMIAVTNTSVDMNIASIFWYIVTLFTDIIEEYVTI